VKRHKLSGPFLRIVDFLPRAGLWQLSERVYLSPALGFVGGDAAIGLPPLQAPNCLLRQHAGHQLAASEGPLPALQNKNFPAVPFH